MTVRAIFGGEAIDATPDQFTFTDVSGINPSTVTTSGTVTVTGLSPNIPINVTATGGTVDAGTSSLSGTFAASKAITTSATGTFVMAARATSSASFLTAVDVVVTVNGVSDTFTVTTRAADTTPNAFTFTDKTSAEINTVYSTSILPSGYDSANWTVSGGQGSTDNSTWSTSGSITSGQTFYIRGTSSSSYSTAVNITATIGGVSDTYTITTRDVDLIGDIPQFNDVTNAELNTVYTSNTVTAYGFDPNVQITLTAYSAGYIDVGTTALSGTFQQGSRTVTTSASGTFVIAARQTSSSQYSTVNGTMILGAGNPVSFNITTLAADTTPNAFSFTDVSNASLSTVYTSNTVTVSGMSPNVAVTVSASGGTVDAGTSGLSGTFAASKTVTTSASGTIVVAARVTSSGSYTTAVNCTVTVGGVADTYTVTTMSLPVGEAVFTGTYSSNNTFTWTCPEGVTSVCALCVGHGGNGNGGGGGGLSYTNNLTVVPGTSYTVNVGGFSYYDVSSFLTVSAGGGNDGQGAGGTGTRGVGGKGNIGGGGAGGYSGNGGAGTTYAGVAGSAGAGGGGGGGSSYQSAGGGGGGVGLYGQGANGAGGNPTYQDDGGFGGSDGTKGSPSYYQSSKYYGGKGGAYGGGRGSGSYPAGQYYTGGVGAVRIIWGPGRSFPSNAT